MTIKDYQDVLSLDSGATNYVTLVGGILNIDKGSSYTEAYKEIVNRLDVKPLEKIPKFFMIGNKMFFYEKDFLKIRFEQFSRLDAMIAEDKNIQNLHLLLAIFLRPVNLFKRKIKTYNLNEQEKIAYYIQNNMDIEQAMTLMVFFYHVAQKYINYTKMHFSQMIMEQSTLIKNK